MFRLLKKSPIVWMLWCFLWSCWNFCIISLIASPRSPKFEYICCAKKLSCACDSTISLSFTPPKVRMSFFKKRKSQTFQHYLISGFIPGALLRSTRLLLIPRSSCTIAFERRSKVFCICLNNANNLQIHLFSYLVCPLW